MDPRKNKNQLDGTYCLLDYVNNGEIGKKR